MVLRRAGLCKRVRLSGNCLSQNGLCWFELSSVGLIFTAKGLILKLKSYIANKGCEALSFICTELDHMLNRFLLVSIFLSTAKSFYKAFVVKSFRLDNSSIHT